MAHSTSIPAVQLGGRATPKQTKFIIGGMMIVLAIAYLIYTGMQSTAAYFLTIDELYAKGAAIENRTVRVAGKVDAATINFNSRDLSLTFEVVSETGQRLPVIFNGPKPDQMREGAEAILEGKYDGQTFTAQSLLLKCPSRYEEGAPEEIQVEAVR
jgi:cytochrome c-type biogenesis protein CcmE